MYLIFQSREATLWNSNKHYQGKYLVSYIYKVGNVQRGLTELGECSWTSVVLAALCTVAHLYLYIVSHDMSLHFNID